MSKKSCPIFVVYLLHDNGPDFLDTQYPLPGSIILVTVYNLHPATNRACALECPQHENTRLGKLSIFRIGKDVRLYAKVRQCGITGWKGSRGTPFKVPWEFRRDPVQIWTNQPGPLDDLRFLSLDPFYIESCCMKYAKTFLT